MTAPGPRSDRQALDQRRRQLVQHSQAQRAALAEACAGADRRLRWIDTAWRAAVWLGRHRAVLALPAMAWGWWAARRVRGVALPQSAPRGGGRR